MCFSFNFSVLVTTFWKEGKIDNAVEAVLDMEQRGVVGAASVYYELACCLCNKGRWRDAMVQVCYVLVSPLLSAGSFPTLFLSSYLSWLLHIYLFCWLFRYFVIPNC